MKPKFDSKSIKSIALIAGSLLGCVTLAIGVSGASAAETMLPPQQLSTPTATQGQVSLPTATNTQIGGPTATVTRTPTTSPVLARTFGEPTRLRSAPTVGDDRTIIIELPPGTDLPVVGRWLGYDWYLVKWDDAPGGVAWVHGSLVTIIGDETTVPAVTPPPVATDDPAVIALGETSTAVALTPGAADTATAQAMFAPTGIYTVTPAGGVGNFGAAAPTFTAPAPINSNPDFGSVNNEPRGGIPPAVVIVSLGGMGLLTLAVGVLRRL
jgi:hypothetical protein